MVELADHKKLKSILDDIKNEANAQLRAADDMKRVYQAQTKLDIVEIITTQFFTEKKASHEQRTTLRI